MREEGLQLLSAIPVRLAEMTLLSNLFLASAYSKVSHFFTPVPHFRIRYAYKEK